MLVVIKLPYIIKNSVRKELEKEYKERLDSGNLVLVVDPNWEVSVYKKSEEDIDVKVLNVGKTCG